VLFRSLDQLVLDSMMRIADETVNEAVVVSGPPSRHRRKRTDKLPKFPCRWRRPSEDVKVVTSSSTVRSHPVPITSTTVTSGARPKTQTRTAVDGNVQRRSQLPPDTSPINCTGVRIVIGGSSGSDVLNNEWTTEFKTCPQYVVITTPSAVDLGSVVGSSSSSPIATAISNSSSPFQTAAPVAVSATPSPSVIMAKGTLTLTSGFSRANVVNDDFTSAVTPTSTGSQLFLLGDTVK